MLDSLLGGGICVVSPVKGLHFMDALLCLLEEEHLADDAETSRVYGDVTVPDKWGSYSRGRFSCAHFCSLRTTERD
jgi:hypothetical protein